MESLEAELKQLIVSALNLKDVTAEQIDSHASLFGDGLGLDSIDVLELTVALEERYGVKIQPDDENHRRAFESVATLASFVERERSAS